MTCRLVRANLHPDQGAGSSCAKAVEFDTGTKSGAPDSTHTPIVIAPKHARALAWPGVQMGTPGGRYLRLSGSLRTHVLRAILSEGHTAARNVFVFSRRVVQQGQKPRPYLPKGLEEAIGEIFAYVEQAAARTLGLGYCKVDRGRGQL